MLTEQLLHIMAKKRHEKQVQADLMLEPIDSVLKVLYALYFFRADEANHLKYSGQINCGTYCYIDDILLHKYR